METTQTIAYSPIDGQYAFESLGEALAFAARNAYEDRAFRVSGAGLGDDVILVLRESRRRRIVVLTDA